MTQTQTTIALTTILAAAISIAGCNKPSDAGAASTKPVTFASIASEAGIDFKHENGSKGRKLMPETVGSGLAFFDYDNDGDTDLLVINSSGWSWDKNPLQAYSALYQNDGKGKFTNVTKEAGLHFSLYGMGVAVGDYDNDGWDDLYITAVGDNRLLKNVNGKFTDVTKTAGVKGVGLPGLKPEFKWSSGAAWVDYDNDGKLDLFVCQYVKWSTTLDPYCGKNGVRGYCPPGTFEGARNTLYHNEGDGTFKDVSKPMGILDCAVGKSFGIALADYNGDNWIDIAVSNDTWANFLFINEGGKKFVERGVETGIAFAENGRAKAGMGIDAADYKNDGNFSLVIGNFAEEGLSLFDPMEGGAGMFENNAQSRGLVSASLLNVTFATFFFDYDLDGWQDLYATNGHVDDIVSTYQSNLTFKQAPLLFHNEKGKKFNDVSKAAGMNYQIVGRGAAYGDIDSDGDLDIGVVDNNGKFLLLRNDGGNNNSWIKLRLVGEKTNRNAIGARVIVKAGGIQQQQYVRSGGSFLSESERTLTFGLGGSTKVDSIEVIWPGGTSQVLPATDARSTYLITEGKGLEKR
ncbi:MAG: CRTAC1 family protein [Armatimonadaceae bacterium]